MTHDEFIAAYSAMHRCIATYRASNGDRLKGLILDYPQTSATGNVFVWIDNFHTRIPLERIEEVNCTDELWPATKLVSRWLTE